MRQQAFDLVIVGAGFVGSSLALALSGSGLRIALVETTDLQQHQPPSFDDRGIACSLGSMQIFDTLGLGDALREHATAIRQIHVSDRGAFGVTRLRADDCGVPTLGSVIPARMLGQILSTRMQALADVQLFAPDSVTALDTTASDCVQIQLASGTQLSAKLVAAADGQRSTLRELLGLATLSQEYQQVAITANVVTERDPAHTAYQRFTAHGPIALLPLGGHRSSLIWTFKSGEQSPYLSLEPAEFLARLQDAFGYRLGAFEQVGARQAHSLGLQIATQSLAGRVVLLGNAAHSLHPVAGQGFNLGLRDVAVLSEVVRQYPDDCGAAETLERYAAWQLPDQERVIAQTHRLVTLFSRESTILRHLRGFGLASLDLCPPLKRALAQQAMGRTGRQTRLMRGLKP